MTTTTENTYDDVSHFSGQTVYQLKQSLLDDYLIQQLGNPAFKMVVA
jgi:hypothetical protein